MKSASIRSRMRNFQKIKKQMLSDLQRNKIENCGSTHVQKKKSCWSRGRECRGVYSELQIREKMSYNQFTFNKVWIWASPGWFHESTTASKTFRPFLCSFSANIFCCQNYIKFLGTLNTISWLEISQAKKKSEQRRKDLLVCLSFVVEEGEKSFPETSTYVKSP